jgi:hypothetical protein
VPFTIAIDGPEMMRTQLRDEFDLLLRIGEVEEGLPGGEPARARGDIRAVIQCSERGRTANTPFEQ